MESSTPGGSLVHRVVFGLLVAAVAMASFVQPVDSFADIEHGIADFNNGGFDFSERASTWVLDDSDVLLIVVVEPPLGWVIDTISARIRVVADSTLTEVTTAPSDWAAYSDYALLQMGVTYVVKTFDGFYAKFAMTEWVPYVTAEFEYYVQLDGTTNLATPVATEPTTWGRVKALYVP